MNNNRGWRIYHKMPRDIQDLMSVHLMNNTKEYFRNNVAPYLIEKAMKKNKICCIIDYYKNKYNVLNIDYIYNLLERDLLEWIKDICWSEDQFEIFIIKIFNDKNIDNIKEKYESTYVVHKILMNLSYDNMVKFEKMNTLN
tara:strand:+ start:608 stop:1030 length:423 start_codon:yes stop_codon:yes gene_type:complete